MLTGYEFDFEHKAFSEQLSILLNMFITLYSLYIRLTCNTVYYCRRYSYSFVLITLLHVLQLLVARAIN